MATPVRPPRDLTEIAAYSAAGSIAMGDVQTGKRFFQKHGYLPANHTYAIRGDIYRQYPGTAFNLYAAFVKVKELY